MNNQKLKRALAESAGQETLEVEGLHQSPIVCNPYRAPQIHWNWDEANRLQKIPTRRAAGYYYKTERFGAGTASLFDQNWDELTLVNRLRDDVTRWRESGYQNPSPTVTTRKLLNYWFERERERPFFFCQREAVETLIYLAELRLHGKSSTRNLNLEDDDLGKLLRGERPSFYDATSTLFHPTLIDAAADRERFPIELRRAACKMATGSGKTVVMALMIAWSFCNAANAPDSEVFSGVALICAPNLTVKERLQVLRPDVAGNYFEAFDIVPPDLSPALKKGKVIVSNWHNFAPRSPHSEGGKTYRVIDKGAERPDDMARRVLGDAFGVWPILVFNDEGHHCWRPAPVVRGNEGSGEIFGRADEDEREEATIWTTGLDALNNAREASSTRSQVTRGISLCIDLSATPFYIAGSGHPEGSPFPWIVSDFGLTDAIESGIVKIPRVPVNDTSGRADPKYFRLWKHINEQSHPAGDYQAGGRKRLKAEIILRDSEDALIQLAGEWKRTFDELQIQNAESGIPPVMIIVCDNTDVAQLFYERISGEREEERDGKKVTLYNQSRVLDEFVNSPDCKRTIRIDTKLLAQAESDDPNQKKSDAAEALRRVVSTVGRRGEPGEQVRCVVSVAMLTEGWDANNVTHILGVRAFGSQLLCEQVVGRGLRRISYEVDPATDLLGEEYADVYGIPFSVVPFRGKASGAAAKPDPPLMLVKALPERKELELRFPVVESYAFALRHNKIRCDMTNLQQMPLDATQTPRATFVAPIVVSSRDSVSAAGTPFQWEEQNREDYYQQHHLQTIKFMLAENITTRLVQNREEFKTQARYQLFPQVMNFVEEYVGDPDNGRKGRVLFGAANPCEIGLQLYFERIAELIAGAIEPDDAQGETPLLPVLNRFQPIGSTSLVNFATQRTIRATKKSHISAVVGDTQSWEQAAATQLELIDCVKSYARNDRLGLRIPYEYSGIEHFYEPDFLVQIEDEQGKETMMLLEIKGYSGAQEAAKHDAAERWRKAVNNWITLHDPERLGLFRPLMVCYEPQMLAQQLTKQLGTSI